MRKLIISTFIMIIVMIVWISYQKYDTKRFIEELPLSSHDEKQQLNDTVANSTVKDTDVTLVDNLANTKHSQHESSSTSLSEGESEDGGQPLNTVPDVGTKSDILDPDPTLITPKVSPEMQAMYSEFNVIYDQYVKVSKEYIPLSKQMSKNTTLYNNYGQQYQSANGNIEKMDELAAEYDDLVKWLQVNTPIYRRLQTEVYSLNEEIKNFLKSKGYSSRNAFNYEAYFAWRLEQLNNKP